MSQSHAVGAAQMINFGMDLTPLVEERIHKFAGDVSARVRKLS
jgi:hypothetical protein